VHRDNLYAPSELTSEKVEAFYRYCSQERKFVEIAVKEVTLTTDAVVLK